MELLIVRHAIAFEADSKRWPDDAARPLSPAGIRRAAKAAAGLKELTLAPERLLTSPLIRAAQTAQILHEAAGWPAALEVEELAPGVPLGALLALLRKERSRRVAVVGHQPGLGELIAAFVVGEGVALPLELKKNSVACLEFEGSPRAGRGVLKWLAGPRLLRGLQRT
jgi:phosphohistidine phosphatase